MAQSVRLTPVGALVGMSVGSLVGSVVGSVVGRLVGASVGSLVGSWVGSVVGTSVDRKGKQPGHVSSPRRILMPFVNLVYEIMFVKLFMGLLRVMGSLFPPAM